MVAALITEGERQLDRNDRSGAEASITEAERYGRVLDRSMAEITEKLGKHLMDEGFNIEGVTGAHFEFIVRKGEESFGLMFGKLDIVVTQANLEDAVVDLVINNVKGLIVASRAGFTEDAQSKAQSLEEVQLWDLKKIAEVLGE